MNYLSCLINTCLSFYLCDSQRGIPSLTSTRPSPNPSNSRASMSSQPWVCWMTGWSTTLTVTPRRKFPNRTGWRRSCLKITGRKAHSPARASSSGSKSTSTSWWNEWDRMIQVRCQDRFPISNSLIVVWLLTLLQWCTGALQGPMTSLLGVITGQTKHSSDHTNHTYQWCWPGSEVKQAWNLHSAFQPGVKLLYNI